MRFCFWLIVIGCMVGCSRPAPQTVYHKNDIPEPDSALMRQLAFNQHMADAADRECIRYVRAQRQSYVQDESGYWWQQEGGLDCDTLCQGQKFTLYMRIFEFSDSLLADVQSSFIMGIDQFPIAIQRGLHTIRAGGTLTLIAPWYTAYGVQGNQWVKPYTNIKIIMKVDI